MQIKNATQFCAVLLMPFFVTTAIAGDGNSGVSFAHMVGTGPKTIHVERVVKGEQEFDYDLVYSKTTKGYKILRKRVNSCFALAPQEQYSAVRFQSVTYPSPPAGFGSVIGWLNAVNVYGQSGSVRVKALRLYGIDSDGNQHLVTEGVENNDQVQGYSLLLSDWQSGNWPKYPTPSIFTVSDGVVDIPTSGKNQNLLFHAWNAAWPRSTANPSWKYFVEAEVLPIDGGMIQVGLDYWTTINSGTNIEGAVSSWVCSDKKHPNRWIAIRTPVS